jgi:hypothetical protein
LTLLKYLIFQFQSLKLCCVDILCDSYNDLIYIEFYGSDFLIIAYDREYRLNFGESTKVGKWGSTKNQILSKMVNNEHELIDSSFAIIEVW